MKNQLCDEEYRRKCKCGAVVAPYMSDSQANAVRLASEGRPLVEPYQSLSRAKKGRRKGEGELVVSTFTSTS